MGNNPRAQRLYRCRGGFLLDGFPRTLTQANALQDLLRHESLNLDAVWDYELPLTTIIERLSGRRTCGLCKAVFHASGNPPQREGFCDKRGNPLVQREDDRPESVAVRIDAYARATAPLIDLYRSHVVLLSVAATGTAPEICDRAVTSLENRRAQSQVSASSSAPAPGPSAKIFTTSV